ncbi:MAG TPA: PEP-CTERM sorting domain-containing protein, partial [Chthoniobacteraceae bacterium]|nr:PEP-CTERM sorting domain-containing protein [Chthoniobacteraceae bacterium]
FNSDQSLGTLFANESYATYLAGTAGGDTPALGAYGYSNGVAWAVLDHTSLQDPIAEFAVIPEPGTYAMIFSGFGMLIGFQRLRRRSRGKAKK